MVQIYMKKLNVALPDEIYAAVAQRAEHEGINISDVVRNALSRAFALKPHQTIGEVAMEAIRAGATNQQTLTHVQKLFPDSKTSAASIAWYRMTLRKESEAVPTDREAKVAAKWP